MNTHNYSVHSHTIAQWLPGTTLVPDLLDFLYCFIGMSRDITLSTTFVHSKYKHKYKLLQMINSINSNTA